MKEEDNVRLQQLDMTQRVESSREQGLAVISHSGGSHSDASEVHTLRHRQHN